MSNKPINIFLTSFDWHDLARTKPEVIISKLNRDKLYPYDNNFLILSWGPGRYEKDIAPNIRIIRRSARLRFFRPLYDLLTFLYAPGIIQKSGKNFDILFTYDFPLALGLSRAAKIFNIPLVLCLTNLPRQYISSRNSLKWPKLWYQIMIERLAVRRIDAVYTINDAIKRYALERGVPEERIMVYTMDTITPDLRTISEASGNFLRSRFPIPKEHKIFLAAARLEGEKGLDWLIEAFASLDRKDCSLVIAGRGPLQASLEELVEKLGLSDRVFFPGHISRHDYWNAIKDTDIFILLSRAEGLGLVFWEAMYMDVPVIGSRADGIIETIGKNEERGFLWEPEDGIEALEEKIDACLSGRIEDKISLAKNYVQDKLNNSADILSVQLKYKEKQ